MKINKGLIFVLVALLLAGWFYWFQWRPTNIRANCSRGFGSVVIDYESCLHQNGLP